MQFISVGVEFKLGLIVSKTWHVFLSTLKVWAEKANLGQWTQTPVRSYQMKNYGTGFFWEGFWPWQHFPKCDIPQLKRRLPVQISLRNAVISSLLLEIHNAL